MTTARVLLVTDNDILSRGLPPLMTHEQGICCVGGARDREGLYQALDHGTLDIALVDVDACGIEAVELVGDGRRAPRSIALTHRITSRMLELVLGAGARGVASTRTPMRILGATIRNVHAGRSCISPDVTRILMCAHGESSLTTGHPLKALTAREREVLKLIAEGQSSRRIASRFGISQRTVETHRAKVMKKLHLHRTAELVRLAVREGLVEG